MSSLRTHRGSLQLVSNTTWYDVVVILGGNITPTRLNFVPRPRRSGGVTANHGS